MSDDIVTRQETQIDFVEYLRLWASPDGNDQAVKDLHKAADEIERLRSLLERWLTVAEGLYRACGSDPNAYVFDYPLIEAMEVYELAVKMGENK